MHQFPLRPSITSRTLLLGVILVLLAACGGDEDEGPTDPGNVFNRPPTVSEIQWPNPHAIYVGGDVWTLSVDASDADGDELSYHWDWATAEAGGSYGDDGVADPELTFTATPGQYQARVSVTDGLSAPIERIVGFTVGTVLVGGQLTGNVSWPDTDWPLVLTEDTQISSGATLTIQAGAEVQLRRRTAGTSEFNIGLEVLAGGRLVIAGSAASPVILRGNTSAESPDPTHQGIEVADSGHAELRHFRILEAATGLMKRGTGTVILEDGIIRDCSLGYLGVPVGASGTGSSVSMTRVEIRSCGDTGVTLNGSSGTFEELMVRNCENLGLKLVAQAPATSSATLRRCELDSNEGGNLELDRESTVDMACSNLLPAASGYNVVFPADGSPLGGVLPMTSCYWGLASPTSEQQIRDQTFDPEGRVTDTIWLRETDLSSYRSSAINFNDGGDACNQ